MSWFTAVTAHVLFFVYIEYQSYNFFFFNFLFVPIFLCYSYAFFFLYGANVKCVMEKGTGN